MTKDHYGSMVKRTWEIVHHLPGKEKILYVPTAICALLYGAGFLSLLAAGASPLPYLLSPALCFLLVSLLRIRIGRERPYDHFGIPPVGRSRPGKKKSMPSRHAASAAAITLALLFFGPRILALVALPVCVLVCLIRIVSGQHYPSDVLCGCLLSLSVTLCFLPLR